MFVVAAVSETPISVHANKICLDLGNKGMGPPGGETVWNVHLPSLLPLLLITIFTLSVLMRTVAVHLLQRLHFFMPATLIVNRNAPDDAQQRQILVFLDGEPIAELMYGNSVTKEIVAGPHALLVDNTWNKKSAQFDAADGATIRFGVKNHSGRIAEFFLMIFGAGPLKVSLDRL